MLDNKEMDSVIQNLKDAGCKGDLINEYLQYKEGNDIKSQINLLEIHRKKLLAKIHKDEKKISCLDYLIYTISKQL